MRLHLLDGPGEGSGPARLLGLGRPRGLVACTDADTVVGPDWLATQLGALSRGARAIGGPIELADDGSLPARVLRRHAEQGRRHHERLLCDPAAKGAAEHWQFSGASLGLEAELYREIGSLEPLAALEDEGLERVLLEHHIPIERLLSVKVTTSPGGPREPRPLL